MSDKLRTALKGGGRILHFNQRIRKSAPQSKDGRAFRWPLTVLVYVSGTGAVQGKFTCPGWFKTNLLEILVERSRVPLEVLRTYAKGGSLYR